MKYVMDNEFLVTDTVSTNAEILQHDYLSNAFRFLINVFKSSCTRGYKILSALLCETLTDSLSKTLYKDVYEDYLFYKEHCNGKMSYRVWCRYGSMLLDVDRNMHPGNTHSANELDLIKEDVDKKSITTGLEPFTINVKNFKPYSA